MELIWNERNGARVVYCGVAQALVEGEVPQLQDRLADTILSAPGMWCCWGWRRRKAAYAWAGRSACS